MNITPMVRSITEYAMKLSEQDAADALTDPFGFGEKIAEQLRAAGAVAPNGNGNGHAKAHAKPGKRQQITLGKKRPNHSAATGATCPQCSKTLVTQGMLARHLRQKHGQATASAVTSSSSPA